MNKSKLNLNCLERAHTHGDIYILKIYIKYQYFKNSRFVYPDCDQGKSQIPSYPIFLTREYGISRNLDISCPKM